MTTKSIENWVGLLVIGGGLGTTIGIRERAAQSVLPDWYLAYGDTLFLWLCVGAIPLIFDRDLRDFLIRCGSLVCIWGTPIILFLGGGGEKPVPGFIAQVSAVLMLALPVMLIGEELIRRRTLVPGKTL